MSISQKPEQSLYTWDTRSAESKINVDLQGAPRSVPWDTSSAESKLNVDLQGMPRPVEFIVKKSFESTAQRQVSNTLQMLMERDAQQSQGSYMEPGEEQPSEMSTSQAELRWRHVEPTEEQPIDVSRSQADLRWRHVTAPDLSTTTLDVDLQSEKPKEISTSKFDMQFQHKQPKVSSTTQMKMKVAPAVGPKPKQTIHTRSRKIERAPRKHSKVEFRIPRPEEYNKPERRVSEYTVRKKVLFDTPRRQSEMSVYESPSTGESYTREVFRHSNVAHTTFFKKKMPGKPGKFIITVSDYESEPEIVREREPIRPPRRSSSITRVVQEPIDLEPRWTPDQKSVKAVKEKIELSGYERLACVVLCLKSLYFRSQ